MKTNRTKNRLASIATVALLGLALLPVLAATGAAAPTTPAGAPALAGQWAYGGQSSSNGSITLGGGTVTWSASFGLVGLFAANNTSASTVELSEQRTVALSVYVNGSGSNWSFQYQLKALEVDSAFANLTRDANVTLSNLSTVPALGILNGSAHSNASLAESFVHTFDHNTSSGYLNVTGHAALTAAFAPALGLVPDNLSTAPESWTATSMLTAASSWGLNVSWARHGPLGSTGANFTSGGGWNGTVAVALYGSTGSELSFHDHVARAALFLALSGPFGLRDGFVLVPLGFDFFDGGSHAYDADAMGNATISSESVFVAPGAVDARSVGAARATFGAGGVPMAVTTNGGVTTSATPSGAPGTTVTAQPESPSQAKAQANCLQFGCGASPNALGAGGLVLVGALVAAAVVGAVLLTRRGRPGQPTSASAPNYGLPPQTSPPANPPQGPSA